MDISQLTEFVGNHPWLFIALLTIIAMLVGGELRQRLSGVTQVGPVEATRLLNREDALMIDMREDKDYRNGHVVNALHAPDVKTVKPEKYRNRPLIVYCRSGNQSVGYCNQLRKQGFETVYNLKGGVTAWERADLPLVNSAGNKT